MHAERLLGAGKKLSELLLGNAKHQFQQLTKGNLCVRMIAPQGSCACIMQHLSKCCAPAP